MYKMPKKVRRLADQYKPDKYSLGISIDSKNMSFGGRVVIKGQKTGRPSKRITLHQKDLSISSATILKIDKRGEEIVEIDRVNRHTGFDELRIHTKNILYPGNYVITIEFSGIITEQLHGLYPCNFKHNGQDKQILATQFESHHAREVFPCIDEPESKAIFDLTLTANKDYTVLSNTLPVKTQTNDKTKTIIFESTPVMSTYLLAFIVGDIKCLEGKTKNNVLVRTFATPDNVDFTAYALDFTIKCLEYFEEYFDIKYPLDKCDLIALPDFASGAMENWGCITFREQALLVDPENSSLSNSQYVALVVAHELAHQWFGNLVTMRWWTDLWLNEGFASWISFLAVDYIYPQWDIWTQFEVEEQQPALKLDALEKTHPIEVPINHPDEIRTIFDTISYCKGASVLSMLHDYLGPNDFRHGLQRYLKNNIYSNTETSDLWKALEESSNKPVTRFMDAWTSKPGFPVIKANIVNNKTVWLTQERFFINQKNKLEEEQLWNIPLLTGIDSQPSQMDGKSISFENKSDNIVKLNTGQQGFYRTAYNREHLKMLGEQINKGRISPVDRLGLLADLFETAKAGFCETVDAIKFLDHFKKEDKYTVWDIIAQSLGSIKVIMNGHELRELMKPYSRELVRIQLARIGWDPKDNESHFDKLLRPIILGLAAAADEPSIIKKATSSFNNLEDPIHTGSFSKQPYTTKRVKRGDIDPELRGVVFGTVAKHGDKNTFEKMLRIHDASTLSEEKNTIVAGLTNFKQPEIINNTLSLIITDKVRIQDISYWIAYSLLNSYAKDKTWQWIKENWQWLIDKTGNDLGFSRLPIYVARVNGDQSFIDEYKEFFSPRITPSIERSYEQGLEMLEWQTAWKKRDSKAIIDYFKNQSLQS